MPCPREDIYFVHFPYTYIRTHGVLTVPSMVRTAYIHPWGAYASSAMVERDTNFASEPIV